MNRHWYAAHLTLQDTENVVSQYYSHVPWMNETFSRNRDRFPSADICIRVAVFVRIPFIRKLKSASKCEQVIFKSLSGIQLATVQPTEIPLNLKHVPPRFHVSSKSRQLEKLVVALIQSVKGGQFDVAHSQHFEPISSHSEFLQLAWRYWEMLLLVINCIHIHINRDTRKTTLSRNE